MRRSSLINKGVAVAVPVLLTACVEYKPMVNDNGYNRGFKEITVDDGSYVLTFVGLTADSCKSFWHKRASELCAGNQYEYNIYKAIRSTVHNGYSGGSSGAFRMEGTLTCKDSSSVAQVQ